MDEPERNKAAIQLDDDGRPKRTGTLWTVTSHIITTVVGSGILSLPWAIAQLGWIAGPMALFAFSTITLFASTLLSDFYRSPDPVTGTRNYTYIDAVTANLGKILGDVHLQLVNLKNHKFQLVRTTGNAAVSLAAQISKPNPYIIGARYGKLSGIAQYANLVGFTVGYTITSANSMVAIKRSQCFHKHGHLVGCHTKNNPFIIIFGAAQIFLSQIPNIHELSVLSLLTTIMCFCHASITLGLSIAKVAGRPRVSTSLTGVFLGGDKSTIDNLWNSLTALGNLAFAYGFSDVLIEIQDTLRSSPPENKVMKQASFLGISISTIFYLACGLLGYAAFGKNAPGNILAGFGFFEPFWLIDMANIFVVIHITGAYQICSQPVFAFVENWARHRWPNARLVNEEFAFNVHGSNFLDVTFFRLIWRTIYVVGTTVTAMMFPFFNDLVGLIGAIAFWPLTVYFPITMYIKRKSIRRFSFRWIWMQILSICCLITSIAAAVGSVGGIIKSMQTFKLFQSIS